MNKLHQLRHNFIWSSRSSRTSRSQGPKGVTGSQGPAGNGYKLDTNNDYDIENKKLVNVK